MVKRWPNQQVIARAVDGGAAHFHAGGEKVLHKAEPFEVLKCARVHDGCARLIGWGDEPIDDQDRNSRPGQCHSGTQTNRPRADNQNSVAHAFKASRTL